MPACLFVYIHHIVQPTLSNILGVNWTNWIVVKWCLVRNTLHSHFRPDFFSKPDAKKKQLWMNECHYHNHYQKLVLGKLNDNFCRKVCLSRTMAKILRNGRFYQKCFRFFFLSSTKWQLNLNCLFWPVDIKSVWNAFTDCSAKIYLYLTALGQTRPGSL